MYWKLEYELKPHRQPNYYIGSNTLENCGVLRNLAFTQTHWKTSRRSGLTNLESKILLLLILVTTTIIIIVVVPVRENDTHKLLWNFDIQTDHLISARTYNNQQQQKKEICKIVDFAVPVDQRIKLKECKKRDKYQELARELKKLWNMKVTIIPIVIGVFDMVTKGLLKGLEDLEVGGRMKTIQTTPLLKTARILRQILET